MGASKKEITQIIRKLEKQGWYGTKQAAKGGHIKIWSPDGRMAILPMTPSEYRGLKNMKAQLRRMGADI